MDQAQAVAHASVYGPLLIATVISSLLYGSSVVQTYIYHDRYPSDHWFMKVFVYSLSGLDTLHLVMLIAAAWHFLVGCIGNYECMAHVPWSLLAELALTSVITFFVQTFYAWRVFLLTKSKLVFGSIMVLCVVQLVSAIVYVGTISRNPTITAEFVYGWVVIMSVSAQILADLLIASASFWTLRQQRGGYHATRTVVGKVIRFTLGTGLAPTVLTLARLLLFVLSHSAAFALFSLTLAKVYSNCLLVSLNARKHFRDMLGDVQMNSVVIVHTSETKDSLVTPRRGAQRDHVDDKPKSAGLVV